MIFHLIATANKLLRNKRVKSDLWLVSIRGMSPQDWSQYWIHVIVLPQRNGKGPNSDGCWYFNQIESDDQSSFDPFFILEMISGLIESAPNENGSTYRLVQWTIVALRVYVYVYGYGLIMIPVIFPPESLEMIVVMNLFLLLFHKLNVCIVRLL